MRKIGWIAVVFLLCSCAPQSQEDKQFELYGNIKTELISQNKFEDDYPFQVSVVYNDLDQTYRYDVIINNPTEDMYQITAMTYSDEDNQQMCPAIGIFDEETYNLKENFIDKTNGFYKGIQLSGTTSTKGHVKLYVQYFSDKEKTNRKEYYIEVKE